VEEKRDAGAGGLPLWGKAVAAIAANLKELGYER